VNTVPGQEANDNGDLNLGGDYQENVLDENDPDLTGETIILYLIG
jgi:hypothetical protein